MIKFVGESGSISYCTCDLYSSVFLLGKNIRITHISFW